MEFDKTEWDGMSPDERYDLWKSMNSGEQYDFWQGMNIGERDEWDNESSQISRERERLAYIEEHADSFQILQIDGCIVPKELDEISDLKRFSNLDRESQLFFIDELICRLFSDFPINNPQYKAPEKIWNLLEELGYKSHTSPKRYEADIIKQTKDGEHYIEKEVV